MRVVDAINFVLSLRAHRLTQVYKESVVFRPFSWNIFLIKDLQRDPYDSSDVTWHGTKTNGQGVSCLEKARVLRHARVLRCFAFDALVCLLWILFIPATRLRRSCELEKRVRKARLLVIVMQVRERLKTLITFSWYLSVTFFLK